MVEQNNRLVPASYGDVLLEYAAVREGGAGLIDLSAGGRIMVSGSEAIQFLNGLVTNDLKTLSVNSWMPAAFPNVQGRLIASVLVVRLADDETGKKPSPSFLLMTEPATHESVLKTIERFTLAGDFRVLDLTNDTVLITVQGRHASSILESIPGVAASEIERRGAVQIAGRYGNTTVIRATHTGEDGFDLIVAADRAVDLWVALQSAGARPVGYDALEILRIEAGIPRYGVDMDETNVVTEALEDAISYTKGCYIGQEIIARIKYRGHVAKKLSGIVFASSAAIAAGALVKSVDDKEIGWITSAAYSPRLGHAIALGYLKYDSLAPATRVKVVSGGTEIAGEVTELPFLKVGSDAQVPAAVTQIDD